MENDQELNLIDTGTGSYVDGMSNEDYHKKESGFSTSNVKDFLKDPALIKWGREAGQDKEKMTAIDFGTAFHSYFLEPEEFKANYKELPVINRKKPSEREAEKELIAKYEKKCITVVTAEDMQKLKAMSQSAMAHPTVNAIMSLDGVAERSFFWTDEESGVKCKCRPDWLVTGITDENRLPFMPKGTDTLVMDVKTIAGLDRIQTQVESLGYYIQDYFYTNGVSIVVKGSVCFVFVFVSTSISLGRYGVQAVVLSDAARFDGKQKVSDALTGYASMVNKPDSAWQTVLELDRPYWATNQEEMM